MSHRKHRLGGLNIHRGRSGAKPGGSEYLSQKLADQRRATDLMADLGAIGYPERIAKARVAGVKRLVDAYRAGRISIEAVRSQARGVA